MKKRYSSMPPFSKLALPNNLRIAATTVRSTDLQQAMPIVNAYCNAIVYMTALEQVYHIYRRSAEGFR